MIEIIFIILLIHEMDEMSWDISIRTAKPEGQLNKYLLSNTNVNKIRKYPC